MASASIIVEDGEYVGNAEKLADFAQQATGGVLFLIQTTETYLTLFEAVIVCILL